jgi:hypothetical protein
MPDQVPWLAMSSFLVARILGYHAGFACYLVCLEAAGEGCQVRMDLALLHDVANCQTETSIHESGFGRSRLVEAEQTADKSWL